jgi:hypothetical protein
LPHAPSENEFYLRTLGRSELAFPLARGRKTDPIRVVHLTGGASYVTSASWGTDETDPTLPEIRRGACLRRNLDQDVYAVHNDGIYSLLRREFHVLNGEKVEAKLVKADLGMMRIAGTLAELVRARDPASQQAFTDAVRLPVSTSPFTRNANKLKGAEMTAKASKVEDRLGRVNPGRLIMLISTGIPAFETRLAEVEGIRTCIGQSAATCAGYVDAVIGVTFECLGHVSKFCAQAKDGKAWDEPNRLELASRLRAYGTVLAGVDALPFRHAFTHTAAEFRFAAELLENNNVAKAASVLEVTRQSMLLQLKLNELQELAVIFSFWEKEVVAPTEDQRAVADHELSRLSKEILAIDESGFKTRVTADVSANVESARECLAGNHYDQVYECLDWGLKAH